ncbi:hypothetical protein HELRODRAFT_180003 [Helobdella robusta]|uniref:Peptidase M12B domain-containing protein n=1 Tax=Helobdella robusta TaxID=6412 RepID=T1FFB8_HELRO|nr:hypothetical protein HELRODRAFT_180003 [Helobdella robusta]ESN94898.1 hypothetical protein HELRODRAFT_180003 [Helobdella robusta]
MNSVQRNVTATLDRENRIVKVYVAVEYEVYTSYKSDVNKTARIKATLFAEASKYYQERDILITILGLEIWNISKITLKPNATQHDLLNEYDLYNKKYIIPNNPGLDTSMLVV